MSITTSPEEQFQRLDELGIAHKTIHHEALFTVEQSQNIRGKIPGAHNKNLFLRDAKGKRHFLVTVSAA